MLVGLGPALERLTPAVRLPRAVALALLGLLGFHVNSISAAAQAMLPAWLVKGAQNATAGSTAE